MFLGQVRRPLPEVTEAKRLALKPGDSLAVRLDREPNEYEAYHIKEIVRAATGVPVVVLGPSADIEVISPDGGGVKVTLDFNGDMEPFFGWLKDQVRKRGSGSVQAALGSG